MNKILFAFLGLFLGVTFALPFETNQKIDPFYLQRLERGERAFLEGNIEKAVEELEIALFGIGGSQELKAKACLYLGLSHYILKNSKKAGEYLGDAKNLLGMDGLKAFVTDETVWLYLTRVMVELKLLEPEAKQPAVTENQLKSPLQKQIGSSGDANTVQDLERRIKSNPRDAGLYYELYEYHQNKDDKGAAKKVLENLIKKNPGEARGYYLLGRIQYKQRNLKDAEKNLDKVFELQKKAPVEENVLIEAVAYQILTLHLKGDKESSSKKFAQWADHFSEDKIRFLDLDGQDRGIFMGIAQNEVTLAEIKRMRARGNAESVAEKTSSEGEVQSTEVAGTDPAPSGGIKAGDLVPLNQVDEPPVLQKRVDPKYPSSAKTMGIEGQVMVSALISETGDVVEVVVIQGLPGGFDEATVTAVKQWKYDAAIKDGQKVRVWKPITITFKKQSMK